MDINKQTKTNKKQIPFLEFFFFFSYYQEMKFSFISGGLLFFDIPRQTVEETTYKHLVLFKMRGEKNKKRRGKME